jgi:hypothetical protein
MHQQRDQAIALARGAEPALAGKRPIHHPAMPPSMTLVVAIASPFTSLRHLLRLADGGDR